jgi:tetratricopeptide (TPR) repeat protein
VIEDLHYHFNPPTATAWRGAASVSPQDYVTALATRLLAAEFGRNQSEMVPAQVRESVDRVSFLPGAVLIWKRDDAELSVLVSRWERLAEQSGSSWSFEALARQILSRGGPLVQAETSARRAIELSPRDPSVHQTLSRVLEQAGDFAGALQAAGAAISLLPAEDERGAGFTRRLETLRQRFPTDAAEGG